MEELTLEFAHPHALYKCYMSFTKDGGLFVETNRPYELGQSLSLSVLLPEEETYYSVAGQVAWVNPSATHSSAPQGIGVAFVDDKHNLKERIEKRLGPLLGSSEPTYTL